MVVDALKPGEERVGGRRQGVSVVAIATSGAILRSAAMALCEASDGAGGTLRFQEQLNLVIISHCPRPTVRCSSQVHGRHVCLFPEHVRHDGLEIFGLCLVCLEGICVASVKSIRRVISHRLSRPPRFYDLHLSSRPSLEELRSVSFLTF